jgi:protease IV
VAEPATLTGSIGVVAGKVVFAGLLDKIGAGWSAVEVGADAGLFSPLQDFSPAGQRRFEAVLDDIYAGFKSRVAEGRKMDAATVEAVAKGRIWSGADAKAKGLIDALGGYATALELAKKKAGIPAASNVTVKLYPPPESAARALIARLLGREPQDDTTAALARAVAQVAPLLAELLRHEAPPGALVMAPVTLH